MAVGTAYNVHVFFSKLFIKKAGGKTLILAYSFSADRAGSFYSGLAYRIAVGTAHYNHQLVGNIHWAENFGNQIFPDVEAGLTDGTLYVLKWTVNFLSLRRLFTITEIKNKQGNYKGRSRAHY